jgi:RNA polymerase sigma factor FliA
MIGTLQADHELMEKYIQTGDASIREEIILRYVPLVHFVLGRLGVRRYKSSDYDDFESQGLLGLIEAVDHYNPAYGTRLSTYATLKIRSKVLDYLRQIDWLPRTARERVRMVQKGVNKLETKLQRLPTEDELAEFLQMDDTTLQKALLDSSCMVVSLDMETNELSDSESMPLYERISDENQANPSVDFEGVDSQTFVAKALQELPERERTVLSLYYYDELTFKEIGQVLSISESRVCQIHGRAIINLNAKLKSPE